MASNNNRTTKKRKPLGKPIEWTDSDLQELARITPADLKAAAALWSNTAPKPLQGIMQAEVKEHEYA